MPDSHRGRIFAGLVTACALGAVAYLLVASRAPQLAPAATKPGLVARPAAALAGTTAAARRFLTANGVTRGKLIFRDLDRHDTASWARIATAALAAGGKRQLLGTAPCEG